MDNTEIILWIIALILVVIVIFLLSCLYRNKTSEKQKNEGTGSSGSEKPEKPAAGTGGVSAGGTTSGGGSLYIPPEMIAPVAARKKTDGKRPDLVIKTHENRTGDQAVHGNQDEKDQTEGVDPESGIVVIYRYKNRPFGWMCPFCEAENGSGRERCCACGQKYMGNNR